VAADRRLAVVGGAEDDGAGGAAHARAVAVDVLDRGEHGLGELMVNKGTDPVVLGLEGVCPDNVSTPDSSVVVETCMGTFQE
jgi:hypothetical protein